MNDLKAGFARVNATPMLGISISGYFEPRYADGTLDELELSALAISCGNTKALLISMDILEIPRENALEYKAHISEVTGVPNDCIYIHATHTHTGPTLAKNTEELLVKEYDRFLSHRMAAVSQAAIADLKPAKMGWAIGKAPNVAFIRRYRMKDGSVKTNPGINNPDIEAPIGEVDTRVNILRFDRENAKNLVLVNFGNHPDVIGGCKFSADWPGFLRKTVEQALPECKCIFFNGCQGDVNHYNVRPKDTDRPVIRTPEARYAFSRYLGRAMAGTVLQEYDKVKYIDVDSIRCMQKTLLIPSNMAAPKELPEAHRINDMYKNGQIKELRAIYPGMMYETVVGEAERMVALENGPENFEMDLSAVVIGSVVLIGLPGEPFTGIGLGLKEAKGWDVIMPTCLTNGSHGYFPMLDSYLEGGYEARTSYFKAGAAEKMIEEGTAMLDQLLNQE